MIPALIALLLSWALLHFVEHQSIEALGFRPTARRLRLVGIGAAITVLFMIAYSLLESAAWHTYYHVAPRFSLPSFFILLWNLFCHSLLEELVFRGALLYILIRRLGPMKAVLISSVVFGVYHWWLIGIHGPGQMMLLFLSMAWLGYALAQSFVVTGTILVPLALHFSINLIGIGLFGDTGGQPFVHGPGTHPSTIMIGLLTVLHSFIYPLLVLLWLRRIKPGQGFLARLRGNK